MRKGIECADAMIDGLLDGMQLTDSDRVFWIDLVPNEFFGYAHEIFEGILCVEGLSLRACM